MILDESPVIWGYTCDRTSSGRHTLQRWNGGVRCVNCFCYYDADYLTGTALEEYEQTRKMLASLRRELFNRAYFGTTSTQDHLIPVEQRTGWIPTEEVVELFAKAENQMRRTKD